MVEKSCADDWRQGLSRSSREGVSVVMVGRDLMFGDGGAGGYLRKDDEFGGKVIRDVLQGSE